ncbi:CBS domain-containing protein [Pseudalkalibacillus caeni]|uniref:CBS domain-containing protein n=1 Tax=Exobacillus caeni TaxID=2574798 RepID=A0A5R9FHS4_9BACL|nr:CBS domain-containing protein [Pseudalkalibacillus caeni]TLS39125.1 CBS domain-containing protein [Pseudalkalibacillus caeni]
MTTKHEQILNYIESLDVGNKISVRQIAKELSVSEGTAYRAIKDAENKGIVSTIERVGTIRITKKEKGNIEKLTYAEVVNIVDGQVLGGREGLHKTLNKFVIGAMKMEAMMRYVDPGSLLIVGNRDKVHKIALEEGAAVLITGGFDATDDVKRMADETKLPLISSSYDSFTVATLINRAIYDRLIKKDIVLVSDILTPLESTSYIYSTDKVSRWHELNEQTKHSRYPIVDEQMKVRGIVTSKDILGANPDIPVSKVMTKNPLTVSDTTSVAAAAHMMIWEGIEMLPVLDQYQRLIGIISRQDVLKALQMVQKQPQIGETFDDLITSRLEDVSVGNDHIFRCEVTPQMANQLGTLSYGVATTLITEAGSRSLRKYKKGDLVVENMTLYFLKPVQIEKMIEVRPKVLEVSRKFGKVDIELYHEGTIVGKALMMAQLIDR